MKKHRLSKPIKILLGLLVSICACLVVGMVSHNWIGATFFVLIGVGGIQLILWYERRYG